MRHIMIDCETLSTRHDAMIVQIGLAEFDPNGRGASTIARWAIRAEEQNGGHIDINTVKWWMGQSEAARKSVFFPDECYSLNQALRAVDDIIARARLEAGEVRLWARGDMDRHWLESAFRRGGGSGQWEYWEWRDQREYCRPWVKLITDTPPQGVAHDALSDCMTQIWWVQQVRRLTAGFGAEL